MRAYLGNDVWQKDLKIAKRIITLLACCCITNYPQIYPFKRTFVMSWLLQVSEPGGAQPAQGFPRAAAERVARAAAISGVTGEIRGFASQLTYLSVGLSGC